MPKKWTTVRTTSPSSLAVSVAEAKKHLRIADADIEQDDYILQLVESAIEKVQRDTGKQLITCTFRQDGCDFDTTGTIQYGPMRSVLEVTYIDSDGVTQTLDPSVYSVDLGRQIVKLQYCQDWPDTAIYDSAVSVTYSAGYGDDSGCVPRLIKSAVLVLVGQWFFDPAADLYASQTNLNAYERIINSLMRASYP